MSLKVLLVEDSATKAMRNRTILELAGFSVVVASDGEEALALARDNRPDAVVSDIQMPKMDGFELSRAIRLDPELRNVPILLLTEAFPEAEDESLGRESGADAYIRARDAGPVILIATVREAIIRRLEGSAPSARLPDDATFHRRHADRLRGHLVMKGDELQDARHALEIAYDHTLGALVGALDLRDRGTEVHSWRVSEYSLVLGRSLGLEPGPLAELERGALLHDIGKIAVPDHVLKKPEPLDESEWEEIRKHPRLGYEMLVGIEFLRGALDVVLCHHERWDGEGYPQGLRAEAIPRNARIFAVAEALDAITSDVPYGAARSFEDALEEVGKMSGSQFDPEVVDAAMKIRPAGWQATKDSIEEEHRQRQLGKAQAQSQSPPVLWNPST